MSAAKSIRAIDLYAGVGGWALGLELAGIEVVRGYEWWQPAVNTYAANLHRVTEKVDIRQLTGDEIPSGVNAIVGSPPCTQFSFANRGGSGNIADGLKDVAKFLEIVSAIRPAYWAMENVPRVAGILESELGPRGYLTQYAPLFQNAVITVVDMSLYGLPQRRKRMLAGNFNLDLLQRYQKATPRPTLGLVLRSLSSDPVSDPNFGLVVPRSGVSDLEMEEPLDPEELRINREAKRHHPVYNRMQFPDSLDEPARTVTATCTRVSRESIVVGDRRSKGAFRRLSVRERACLQGFPVTYSFIGGSFQEKVKMVGNAIPPVFTYFLGCCFLGLPPETVLPVHELHGRLPTPTRSAPSTPPERPGRRYPASRSFRFAIRHLRFGSGVRFDLANSPNGDGTQWRVAFFHGSSKRIGSVDLNPRLLRELEAALRKERLLTKFEREFSPVRQLLRDVEVASIQRAWTHRGRGLHPFKLADAIGRVASRLTVALPARAQDTVERTVGAVLNGHYAQGELFVGIANRKLHRHRSEVFVGLFLGSAFNAVMAAKEGHEDRLHA